MLKSFEGFFTLIGQDLAGKVEFVCSDMWRPYLQMIARHCPQALNIPDRFPMAAKLNKALDEVRAGEARRMLRQGYEPLLKKKRWCLLKRPENLTDKQRLSLRELLGYNLKSVRAYLLKEEFQLFWEYVSPAWAGKFLDAWCKRALRSGTYITLVSNSGTPVVMLRGSIALAPGRAGMRDCVADTDLVLSSPMRSKAKPNSHGCAGER